MGDGEDETATNDMITTMEVRREFWLCFPAGVLKYLCRGGIEMDFLILSLHK